MTALAGVVGTVPQEHLRNTCQTLLAGQQRYASCDAAISSCTGAAFGAALFRVLPEDSGSESGLVANEQLLIAADIRLDNREEIAALAGLRAGVGRLSDIEIILAAWARLGEACIDKLTGDFAIAVYDQGQRLLTLARDATGQRPLFYARSKERMAFSSMPSGLLNDQECRRGWNYKRLAAALLDIHDNDPDSYFTGIQRVLPGEVVRLSADRIDRRLYWQPKTAGGSGLSLAEAAEQYRHLLDAAVKCRLRRASGGVAVQLSAGYDSSAVATTAASQTNGSAITAFTAAPMRLVQNGAPRGRLADESAYAALTAHSFGMTHGIVHSGDLTLAYLQRQTMLCQDPARNWINHLWGSQILLRAADEGATVLLTGTYGNLSLNADALQVLPDWLRLRGPRAWWRQACAVARRDDVRWRGILFNSFAPWLPHWLWASLLTRFKGIERPAAHSFASAEWLNDPRAKEPQRKQPLASSSEYRLQDVRNLDDGVFLKSGVADAAVVELQPLADRRLIEFSLRFAPEHLLNDGEFRPVARRALSDRVPAEVLDLRLRGMQSADWRQHFHQSDAFEILDEIHASDTARDLLDVEKMRAAISNWPARDDHGLGTLVRYMSTLPTALGVGVFIREFEKSWAAMDLAHG